VTQPLSRRSLLTGAMSSRTEPERYHVSSAVVLVTPAKRQMVRTALGDVGGVEIVAEDASHLVVVIEGGSTGELGAKLTSIALMEGVLAANMVFEQAERLHNDSGSHSS
jgi:periplasmic nitrate reductase NapD